MKFVNLKKPDDALLATQVTPPTYGESGRPSYPLQVNKTWDLLGLSMDPQLLGTGHQDFTDVVEVYAVTAVYIERPLKWWQAALNRFGGNYYTRVKRIPVDPEHGKFRKAMGENPSEYLAWLDRYPLHVVMNAESCTIMGVAADPNVLGFDIDAVRVNGNRILKE